jgi:uncharacterized protein (TIGR00269 family)
MGNEKKIRAPGLCHCGEEGVVFLHYAEKHLCEKHFIHMFDRRFRKTVRMNGMLKKGDRVAIGLSGGKDSTVLLHSLSDLKKDLPFELVAITIDEGIEGYRARTMVPAKRECEKLGIEQKIFTFTELCGKSLDALVKSRSENKEAALPCSQCGVLRRYALNKAAREVKADKLAIGHNLDDMAQTLLMNIMRAEPSRIGRMNEPASKDDKFVQRIRPLMMTPEKEIAIYAMLKGIALEHVECPYARFAFRNHARKMLNESEERYPGTKFKVMNSFLEIEKAMREQAPKNSQISLCPSCKEPSSKGECMFCRMVRPLPSGRSRDI